MPLHRIAVLGLGKVGTLAAKLLHENGFDVTGFDSRAPQEPLPFGGQRPVARSPRVAPTTILPGHAHHQRNQFCTDARPTKSAPLNERPLLCYQLTVPARQRVGRKDRAKLVQRSASEGPRLLGKLPTLRVREDHALTPASLKVTPLR